MVKGRASGHSLSKNDIPIVLGMAARGDRNHDIAAWFGVNQGRIAETKNGEMGNLPAASASLLPPAGAPGIKGRRIRDTVETIMKISNDTSLSDSVARGKVIELLQKAIDKFDQNEA